MLPIENNNVSASIVFNSHGVDSTKTTNAMNNLNWWWWLCDWLRFLITCASFTAHEYRHYIYIQVLYCGICIKQQLDYVFQG